MPTFSTPDNLKAPSSTDQMGDWWQWFVDLRNGVQTALNALTNQHAEFTALVTSMPNGGPHDLGVFTRDTAASTNAEFVTVSTSGRLLFNSPGLYAVSGSVNMSTSNDGVATPATGRTFADLQDSAGNVLQRMSMAAGEDRVSYALPNLRIKEPGTVRAFKLFRNIDAGAINNSKVHTRIFVTKLGRL